MRKKLKILTINKRKDSEILRKKSQQVDEKEILSKKFQNFLDNLIHTAENHTLEEGWITAGLAAIQVGKPLRVFVILDPETKKYEVYINPEIKYLGNVHEKSTEGCLSLPKTYAEISRHGRVEIKYLDREGNKKKEKISEFQARVVQHEYDHLEGILFTDKS
jgi:peptide deformylase